MATDIEQTRDLLKRRLGEIADESQRLKRALTHLDSNGDKRHQPRSRKASTAGKARGRRRGKVAKRGQRREELVKAIKESPGIRAADLARKLKVQPSHVHSLLRKAQADKAVKKKGQGYVVA